MAVRIVYAVSVPSSDRPQTLYTVRELGRDYAVLYSHRTEFEFHDAWCKTCRSDNCWHALSAIMLWATTPLMLPIAE